ncbi:MAG: hypothetical protein ACE366_23615 [Bradymonadia bacterium]
MNTFLLIAAIFSGITWALHTFLGGRELVPPLLSAEVHPVPKFTHYYCWHLVTLTLAIMALGYLYAAFFPGGSDVAIMLTILSATFALWSVYLVQWKQQRWFQMPQWVLFLSITGVAIPGLI